MSSSALTDADKKYWGPIDSLVAWLADRIPPDAKVLEIGPGGVPFPRANTFVDYRPLPNITNRYSVDLNYEKLPFSDKSFDFVYCRHVIEDMWNPFLLLDEMQRVGKEGYIETPSPVAELGRGVDGSSPPFRGYHHHRNIIWVYEGELRIIAKYPIIEYVRFSEGDIMGWLREGPRFWNTYCLWKDKINYRHIQSGPDFVITRDYASILKNAMDQSTVESGTFWLNVPDKVEITTGALPKFVPTPSSNQKETAHV